MIFASLLLVLPCACLAGSPGYLGMQPPSNTGNATKLTAACSACHGSDGNSVSDAYPNLAGQNYNYLLKQLENFKSGARKSSPMTAMAAGIPPAGGDNLKTIAGYFAAAKPDRHKGANAQDVRPTLQQARDGYRVYTGGAGVPACSACHMDSGAGNAPMAIPALAGQHAQYLEQQLKRFVDGKRANSPHQVMAKIAGKLTDKQRRDVSLYLQELRPALVAKLAATGYAAVANAGSKSVPGIPANALKPNDNSGKSQQQGGAQ